MCRHSGEDIETVNTGDDEKNPDSAGNIELFVECDNSDRCNANDSESGPRSVHDPDW